MKELLSIPVLLSVPVLAQSPGPPSPSDPLCDEDWAGIRAAYLVARCPRSTGPIAEQASLRASNPDDSDAFGYQVAISGDTVAVSALDEDSAATGINGDQSDNSAQNSGAVYVFARTGTSWSQQAYIKASNTGAFDRFGYALAISGDTLVAGAYREDSNATGVNGDQDNNLAQNAGAAYVFVRNGTSWSQQAYLKASNPESQDWFGIAAEIVGDTVVVGAKLEDSGATGVNGNQCSNSATNSGAAYVFVRSGTSWSQQAYLKASNTEAGDEFGFSPTLSGDTLMIGAPLEDSGAIGVNGDQSDNSAADAGAAYAFERTGSSWSQQAYLKASNTDTGDWFGFSLAASGDSLVAGAWSEDSAATGVNGNQDDDGASDSGAAYVFRRSGTVWSQEAYLKASNTDPGDQFAISLAMAGDTILAGAIHEDSSATGIDGDQADNSAPDSGAAYLFERAGTVWSQQAYVKSSQTGAGYDFGYAVALAGDTPVVAATWEGSLVPFAGAVYVFAPCASLPSSETVRLGTPPNPSAFLPGQTSGPVVGATWDPVVSAFHPGAVLDFLGVDFGGPINLATRWGTLLIAPPPAEQLFFQLTPGTPFALAVPHDCALIGACAWAQAGSAAPGPSIAFTNGLDLVFGSH